MHGCVIWVSSSVPQPKGPMGTDPHTTVHMVSAPGGDKIRVPSVLQHLLQTRRLKPRVAQPLTQGHGQRGRGRAGSRVPCSWLLLILPLMPFLVTTQEAQRRRN